MESYWMGLAVGIAVGVIIVAVVKLRAVKSMSMAEKADYLSKRRARTLPALVVIYLSQQVTFYSAVDPAGHEGARAVKIGAWMVLSAVLLAALTTKGFWFQPKEVRDMIDDENTRANRLDAIRYGYIAAMLMALAIYFLTQVEEQTAMETIHLILSAGLGVALVRFGYLERRAHRDA